MSHQQQSKLSAYFKPRISDDEYQQQLQTEVDQHEEESKEDAARQRERLALKRLRQSTTQQVRRRPGRPRIHPPPSSSSSIQIDSNKDNITVSGNGNHVNSIKVVLSDNPDITQAASQIFQHVSNMLAASSQSSSSSSSSSSSGSSSSSSLSSSSSSTSSLSSSTSSSSSSDAVVVHSSTKKKWRDWPANYDLFAIIDDRVQICRNFTEALKQLHTFPAYSDTFRDLAYSTLKNWYIKGSFELKPEVKKRWVDGVPFHPDNAGRPSVLSRVPEVQKFIINTLTSLRGASCSVNSVIASSIIKAILKEQAPDLLKELSISRRWCRRWIRNKLGWTYRKSTTNGQKLPSDWQQQVLNMSHRVAAVLHSRKILFECFIINWDQTAVLIQQPQKYTYNDKKQKQVPVAGSDERRQITAVVAGALSGELLPLQLVFQGQDKDRKQQKAVPTLDEVTKAAVLKEGWHLTQTHNHWSTLDSMQDYVRTIIVPWVNKKNVKVSLSQSMN
jgi:hypothetical protein